MKNLLNKIRFERLNIAALAMAFFCAGLLGCSEETLTWSEERSLGSVVGFVDDSLVIVNSARHWHEEVDPVFGLSYDESGYTHQGLVLYNYRIQLDGPVWSDTLDNSRDDDFEYIKGQLADSVIWGGDPKSEVSFWKIGEKPHKMKIKKMFDGCSIEVPYTTKLRSWLDGEILVLGNKRNPDMEGFALDGLGSEYCQYAVLDTVQKKVTYKRLEGELKWIKKCNDIRAWGNDVYCFMSGERAYEAVLLRNGDSVDVPLKFTVGNFWGDVLQPNADLCSLVDGEVICTGIEWRGDGLKFYQENVIVVEY